MPDEALQSRLTTYIKDTHALELNSLLMLRSMLLNTADPEMRALIEHHVEETERHRDRLTKRLETLGEGAPKMREGGVVMSSLVKGVVDQIRPDKPGKNARDAYVTEQVEIAAYELLSRFADRAGDSETAELARTNLAEERAMAEKLDGMWDKVVDLTVQEEVAD